MSRVAASTGSVASRINALSSHALGLLLTITGVIVLSPDSLLIRAVDADPWTIVFWRALLLSVALAVGVAIFAGGNTVREFKSIGRMGLVVAALFGCQTTLFVTAVSNTSVANVVVIFATAPLWAAILSRIFLGEQAPLRLWAAALVSFGAVAFIFAGSNESGRLAGDLAAAGAALVFAVGLTIMRRHRAVSMVPAWSVGSLMAAAFAAAFATPLSISGEDTVVLLFSGLLVLPVAFTLIALGPRRLSAPETGLIMLLETALAPLWVWWLLSEEPNTEAIIGGAVIVGALAVNSILGLRES